MEKPENNNDNLIKLIKELPLEVISLIEQHLKLVKRELTENLSMLVKSVFLILSAIIIGYAGLIFLGLLIISLLSQVVSSWVALLLVTVIYLGVPLIFVIWAISLFYKVFMEPKKSIAEFKKTGEEFEKWLNNLKK